LSAREPGESLKGSSSPRSSFLAWCGSKKSAPPTSPGWERSDYVASQTYGDAWYDSGRSAVLIVPSLPAMGPERNVLINQHHPQFRHIAQADPRPLIWDARLFAAP
jgi:RES domain-containing protein